MSPFLYILILIFFVIRVEWNMSKARMSGGKLRRSTKKKYIKIFNYNNFVIRKKNCKNKIL